MTKAEIQKKTKEKVMAIQTLCKQLEVSITAEEHIDSNGFIKKEVFYIDTEKYPEDVIKKEDVKPTDIRE